MKDLVSIILPLRESDSYINETIESIRKQVYENIEVLIVYDNISENTDKIIKYHAKQDKRVRLVQKLTKSIDNLKNVGIKNATGKYISFIEDGDKIERTYIFDLLKIMKDNKVDLVCSERYFEDERPHKKITKLEVFEEEEIVGKYLDLTIRSYSMAKLYKTDLFKEIDYPATFYDDFLTTYKIFHASKKCVYVNLKEYLYRKNKKINVSDNEYMQKINGCLDMLSFMETEYPELVNQCKTKICFEAIDLLKKVSDKDYKKQIFEIIKLYRRYAIKDLSIPWKIRSKAIKSVLGLNMLDFYLKFEK